MMLSDVCLSDVRRLSRTSGRRAACAAGRLDGAYWLIGPGLAGLAQGCRCALPLQACAGAYRGGRPPTACCYYGVQTNVFLSHTECSEVLNVQPTLTIILSLQRLHSFLIETPLSPVV